MWRCCRADAERFTEAGSPGGLKTLPRGGVGYYVQQDQRTLPCASCRPGRRPSTSCIAERPSGPREARAAIPKWTWRPPATAPGPDGQPQLTPSRPARSCCSRTWRRSTSSGTARRRRRSRGSRAGRPLTGEQFKLRVLTAQRGGEVLHMRWSAIDLDAGLWTKAFQFRKRKTDPTPVRSPSHPMGADGRRDVAPPEGPS